MHYLAVYFSILLLYALPSQTLAPDPHQQDFRPPLPPHVRGQILVRIDPNFSHVAGSEIEKTVGAKLVHGYALVEGLGIYKFDPRRDVMEVVKSLSSKPFVLYAEPDYIYRVAKTDDAGQNDPEYPRQWALENTGQAGGKVDADINAELMWGYQKGSKDIVVGTVDTGFDFTHPDLVKNVWSNPGEIANNGVDDDNNGYVDDAHGINAINNTGNPMDDNVHGTHVSGIIGAEGNNRLGVVGVAQNVQIAACKFLSSNGTG
ncbi:MAG TPA: S8 family serine peptidase, partial [Myxococcota bacterium]|nr:S8 family serine peptidase [Myxococcota bacterium]